MRKRQALSVLGLAMATALPAAAASEVCVSCSGPSATYRCTVDDASTVENYRYSKHVLKLACITELAREGGHEQCRVQRTGSNGCFGLGRTVSLKSSVDALAAPPAAAADAGPADEREAAPGAAEKPGPPKTVEELARRTASTSKEKVQKTGDKVGSAVKKSWDCLASLFKDC